MVGSIFPTDWFQRRDTPRRRGSLASRPRSPLVDSNLISGPLGPSWGCHHCLAPHVPTPLVLRLSGGPCPRLSWRAQPKVFWPDYCLQLGHRCGQASRSDPISTWSLSGNRLTPWPAPEPTYSAAVPDASPESYLLPTRPPRRLALYASVTPRSPSPPPSVPHLISDLYSALTLGLAVGERSGA